MAKTSLVSGKVILARVIRALGYKLPSVYHDDILEWIAEGLGMIQVTNALILKETSDMDCPGEILVRNFCAKLPCGFIAIERVKNEYGNRLREASATAQRTTNPALDRIRASVFNVNPYLHQTEDGVPTESPGTSIPVYGEDIEQSEDLSSKNYYQIKGNYIQTGFEEGYIQIEYWALPTCDEGYPLIPDNEPFKQAIEWYVIMRLIGSGYEHKVFNYQMASAEFEKWAGRGMNEVSYPTPDTMARINNVTVRLIPPDHFRDDFFET